MDDVVIQHLLSRIASLELQVGLEKATNVALQKALQETEADLRAAEEPEAGVKEDPEVDA